MQQFKIYRALYNFVSFAPMRVLLLNIGSVLQSFTGLFGMFLLLPLARLAGVEFESNQLFSSWPALGHLLNNFLELAVFQSLDGVLLTFIMLTLVMASLGYVQSIVGAQLQRQYIQYMRMRVYSALISARWEFLSANRSSEFLHRLSGQVQSVNATANQIISLLHRLVSLALYTVVMFLMDWKFTLMTIFVGLIIAAILFPVRYAVRDAGRVRLEKYRQVFRLLSEHLGSLKMIKSSGHEWQFQQTVRNASDELEEQQVRMMRAGAIVTFVNRVSIAVGFAVLVYFSILVLDMPVVSFLLLFFIMSRLLPQLAGLQTSVQQIVFSLPAYEDIEKTLDDCQANQELVASKDTQDLLLRQDIELKNVSFAYSAQTPETEVVKNLNFKIKADETVALVGHSGAGKTTVADLIVGLLQPQRGKVLVDGQKLNADNIAGWRRRVAYVTQEIRLFHDSVRNNLIWVNSDVTDDQIWQALETAALKDKIESLPAKLDTIIGDGGGRLSGGERQRLAIARALLGRPDLLVLDEATSALDVQNERLIHQALLNMHGKLTVVIIAHNAATIRHADKILDLSRSPAEFVQIEDFMRQTMS